ncbi:hypothetical protein ACXX9E_29500 [Pseudomonas sp. GNP014]
MQVLWRCRIRRAGRRPGRAGRLVLVAVMVVYLGVDRFMAERRR